jgi:hypothetical protein
MEGTVLFGSKIKREPKRELLVVSRSTNELLHESFDRDVIKAGRSLFNSSSSWNSGDVQTETKASFSV